MTGKAYDVKELALANQGRLRTEWARQEIPMPQSLMDHFAPNGHARGHG
jgi:hypothetical protein